MEKIAIIKDLLLIDNGLLLELWAKPWIPPTTSETDYQLKAREEN